MVIKLPIITMILSMKTMMTKTSIFLASLTCIWTVSQKPARSMLVGSKGQNGLKEQIYHVGLF